jgi:hypothetical protein
LEVKQTINQENFAANNRLQSLEVKIKWNHGIQSALAMGLWQPRL